MKKESFTYKAHLDEGVWYVEDITKNTGLDGQWWTVVFDECGRPTVTSWTGADIHPYRATGKRVINAVRRALTAEYLENNP